MKLREFYESSGVDYDALLQRLMGKESLVEKYVRLFLQDPTYFELQEAVLTNDYTLIELKAHTLKGIALNLNLEQLSKLCMAILDSIRHNNIENLNSQFEETKIEYNRIVSMLSD